MNATDRRKFMANIGKGALGLAAGAIVLPNLTAQDVTCIVGASGSNGCPPPNDGYQPSLINGNVVYIRSLITGMVTPLNAILANPLSLNGPAVAAFGLKMGALHSFIGTTRFANRGLYFVPNIIPTIPASLVAHGHDMLVAGGVHSTFGVHPTLTQQLEAARVKANSNPYLANVSTMIKNGSYAPRMNEVAAMLIDWTSLGKTVTHWTCGALLFGGMFTTGLGLATGFALSFQTIFELSVIAANPEIGIALLLAGAGMTVVGDMLSC
jgi:hypothetical protein